jgi:hypothetical protein
MARTVIIHLTNEDPVMADMEELPSPTATCIYFTNPRKKDGKPVNWASAGSVAFMFAMSRVNFIEVMTSAEERRKVVGWVREE